MMEKKFDDELAEKLATVEENLKHIRESIARAEQSAGRKPGEVILLAATKTVAPEVINRAIELGVDHIGENRVQELCEKFDDLKLAHCEAQMIGHLQTNKVRQVADKVSAIQSVDSLRLAQEISRVCQKLGKTMNILVEVNIGGEENKSGICPEGAWELCCAAAELPGLHVDGLMTIPPVCETEVQARGYFSKMHQLFVDMKGKKTDNIDMNCLSMGMSDDFEAAILEGATMVRVGSALFGKRIYH